MAPPEIVTARLENEIVPFWDAIVEVYHAARARKNLVRRPKDSRRVADVQSTMTDQEFTALVLEAAANMSAVGRHGDKAYIAAVWAAVERKVGGSIEEFKTRLVATCRASLVRGDLVAAMDRSLLKASEVQHLGAKWHFVRG